MKLLILHCSVASRHHGYSLVTAISDERTAINTGRHCVP